MTNKTIEEPKECFTVGVDEPTNKTEKLITEDWFRVQLHQKINENFNTARGQIYSALEASSLDHRQLEALKDLVRSFTGYAWNNIDNAARDYIRAARNAAGIELHSSIEEFALDADSGTED